MFKSIQIKVSDKRKFNNSFERDISEDLVELTRITFLVKRVTQKLSASHKF